MEWKATIGELWKVNNATNEHKQHIWNPTRPVFYLCNNFIQGDTAFWGTLEPQLFLCYQEPPKRQNIWGYFMSLFHPAVDYYRASPQPVEHAQVQNTAAFQPNAPHAIPTPEPLFQPRAACWQHKGATASHRLLGCANIVQRGLRMPGSYLHWQKDVKGRWRESGLSPEWSSLDPMTGCVHGTVSVA